MALSVGASTDAGRRGPPNEDSILVHGPEGSVTLALLADGIGGHNSGEQASREAVTTIDQLMFAGGPPTLDGAVARLHAAIAAANARVFQLAQANPLFAGMGCTLVLALVIDNLYWIGHIGDSRAYLIAPDRAQQLTEDHTWVAARVKEGLLTPEQAARHPRRHVLDQALGAAETVSLTLQRAAPVRPAHHLMLCSDGVHEVLAAETIQRIINENDAEAAAQALITQAVQAGSHDNVSAVVLRWDAALVTDPLEFIDTHPEGIR